jgi:hypothetical protein
MVAHRIDCPAWLVLGRIHVTPCVLEERGKGHLTGIAFLKLRVQRDLFFEGG